MLSAWSESQFTQRLKEILNSTFLLSLDRSDVAETDCWATWFSQEGWVLLQLPALRVKTLGAS